jgi:hypothetical protein
VAAVVVAVVVRATMGGEVAVEAVEAGLQEMQGIPETLEAQPTLQLLIVKL